MSNSYPGGLLTTGADTSYSVAFDGTEDYVKAPAGAAFAYGTGAFTIEGWVYLNALLSTSSNGMIIFAQSVNGSNYLLFTVSNTSYEVWLGGSSRASESVVLPLNTWIHLAAVRESGGAVKLYRNGLLVATGTDSTNLDNVTYVPTIGGYTQTAIGDFRGFISNFRVVKGTAVYTSNFTPPNQLLPVPGTSLLTCQSPTIIDNSGTNVALTVVGNATVSTNTPFAGYKGFNPALGAAAGGVWTLEQATSYQSNRTWPIYDPYFNQTTLLLHGQGTNSANNSSFVDSSSNNFAITRNGNTTQGTFSPFSQTGWSAHNSGSSSYCQLNNADYSLGTGDFTVECWMFVTTDKANNAICTSPSNANFGVLFGGGSSNAREFYLEYASAVTTIGIISNFLNKWTHIAVVRSGGICKVYQNGVAVGSASKAGSVGSTANLYLLRNSGDAGQDFPGYITDLRITKAAVYTSNFIPNTKPLTVVSNTLLLTFQSNRFVDNSALNTTVTPTATTIQAFSPFVPAYITPTTYSNYFDGTGDYLSSSSANYTATGDFTVEAWFYATSNPSFGGIVSTRESSNTRGVSINLDNTQKIRFFINGTDFPASYVAYNLNQWYHVAIVRNGSGTNNVTAYVNGISVGSTTNTATTTETNLVIGRFYTDLNDYYFNGVISNARFVNGTAIYTANFTPPNAPFPTGTTNQQLLTCQASTMIDSNTYTTAKTITANGNVRPVTSPTPFPANVDQTTLNSAYSTSLVGGSAYFDGTGDYLSTPSTTALQLTAATAFTIEAWVYPTSLPNTDHGIIGKRTGGTGEWQFFIKNDKTLHVYSTGGDYTSGTTISGLNQWIHCAVTWDLTTLRFFINGVLCSTTHTSIALGTPASSDVTIGASYAGNELWYGYLSGVRVVKGTALYTKSFAPPIAPPTPVTNTQLLLNYTNAGIIDDTSKNVLETVGNAQISTTQSKFGGSSMYFDGTGDWLVMPTNPGLNLGSGAYTIEFFYRPNEVANDVSLIGKYGSEWLVQYLPSAGPAFRVAINNNSVSDFTSTLSANTWYHIVVCRDSGGNLRMFRDGRQIGSTVTSGTGAANNITATTNPLYIGTRDAGTQSVNGYFNDIRITKGVARYTSNFIPQTSVWQNQ